jgi:hypothetical protein
MTGFTVPQTVSITVPLGHGTVPVNIPALVVNVSSSTATSRSKLNPQQWGQLLTTILSDIEAGATALQIVQDVLAAFGDASVKLRIGVRLKAMKGSLSPAQWEAIIQAILQILPIFFGS